LGPNTKGKNSSKAIIKTTNIATGKESSKDKSFTETNWGVATRGYLSTIRKKLKDGSFAKIVIGAQQFSKMIRRSGDSIYLSLGDPEDDERAGFIDVSDDEGEQALSRCFFYQCHIRRMI
jgi:hypothetical protein